MPIFEWDLVKARRNFAKHGVDFEVAKDVFLDRAGIIEYDDSEPDEERWRIIGLVDGRLLFVVFTEPVAMSSASSPRAKRASVKSDSTMVRRLLKNGRWYAVDADGRERLLPERKPDWSRLDAMTDEEIEAAARSDPDNPPSTPEQLKRMRRISPAKHLRWKLGLSQAEFARRFHIPLGTLRDWEQHRTEPDQAAQAYLKVIATDAGFVERALAS
jgi:putative transcriptional regulator